MAYGVQFFMYGDLYLHDKEGDVNGFREPRSQLPNIETLCAISRIMVEDVGLMYVIFYMVTMFAYRKWRQIPLMW